MDLDLDLAEPGQWPGTWPGTNWGPRFTRWGPRGGSSSWEQPTARELRGNVLLRRALAKQRNATQRNATQRRGSPLFTVLLGRKLPVDMYLT
ncbi:uncharacterized protein UV8b_01295 [Ustilaginoidea virens]|uniref:Uncharacterized protein n=1 Tax=Ustilaginoidea virens TaxID=1159556 RepID=A0A8E5HLA4_USTVR|nr:uncharacterized protein UV8b_01295 [Ustilaginoidea virens]QUC17054.1 hypothetical protein UV8b_01295 [Ustilaginoidea virens]